MLKTYSARCRLSSATFGSLILIVACAIKDQPEQFCRATRTPGPRRNPRRAPSSSPSALKAANVSSPRSTHAGLFLYHAAPQAHDHDAHDHAETPKLSASSSGPQNSVENHTAVDDEDSKECVAWGTPS
ncbi:hypothetical protein B0H16DRAFT_451305 [Mycena metata]|uniref:Secreted protein n=1 Tax=Mycena metata TaxID=1033252 RepID=A0AAD7HB93_9AGAR|nr:hypothetical protein B0H16DRAFT_451305 [Mycena metata]